MKLHLTTPFVALALIGVPSVAHGEPHALCATGDDTVSPAPTVTPAPTTATPAPTTAAPAPLDCKLYNETKDPGAFDGKCVQDPVDKLWYEYKNLSVEIPAVNGGKACVPTRVKRHCPPVNCEFKDAFGVCAVETGTRRLVKPVTRTIVAQPLYGGAVCPQLKSSRLSCDGEYFCGPLTDETKKAACEDAFKKSDIVYVGQYFHQSSSTYRKTSFPYIWDCINACAADTSCKYYDYFFDPPQANECYLVRTPGLGTAGYNTTTAAKIIRA